MCAPGGLRSELLLCHRPSWWLLPFKKSCVDTITKVPSKCSLHLYHIWVPSTPPPPLLSWSPLAPTWTHLKYWNSLHTSLSSILIYPLQFTLYKKIWMTSSPPMTSQLHWSCYNNSNDLTPTSPSDFILYYPPRVHCTSVTLTCSSIYQVPWSIVLAFLVSSAWNTLSVQLCLAGCFSSNKSQFKSYLSERTVPS